MHTSIRLSVFALALVVVFAAAIGVGRWRGPEPEPPPAAAAEHGEESPGHDAVEGGHDAGHDEAAVAVPAGLQTAQDGYRLEPLSPGLSTTASEPFRFRILDTHGVPVTRYVAEHEKDLHLIVVRRDLSGFQHVHPVLGADGTWSIPLAVAAPGQYRVFADFRPATRDEGLTLGVDVPAPGEYRPVALPRPRSVATVDGYTVTLTGELTPGTASTVSLAVSRNGRPVADLQPYLGSSGHLVALREGDLAYLHVHPTAGTTFAAEVPSEGRYRLYFDFRHGDVVHTAEFTQEAHR
ncbi:hypothetical protein [Cryptosporangium sp. NPDC048952]|uniref:hypothetical protein n=1 Tax=Cryptosporangium sp. NPDC048952 TaxID=3363961 RepID=UPI0037142B66